MTRSPVDTPVLIHAGHVRLDGHLVIPPGARGVTIFAHGSGSSRFSSRNQFVARELAANGIGYLLFDLLTESESEDRANVFDIELLAKRLLWADDHVRQAPESAGLPVGYFGASTGAAAALLGAAESPQPVAAVVSRGGRPDLAGAALPAVKAPTLLIVGGDDTGVIELNESAFHQLRCERRIEIVPGATHLFEEPGALERVAELAADWFGEWMDNAEEASPDGQREAGS